MDWSKRHFEPLQRAQAQGGKDERTSKKILTRDGMKTIKKPKKGKVSLRRKKLTGNGQGEWTVCVKKAKRSESEREKKRSWEMILDLDNNFSRTGRAAVVASRNCFCTNEKETFYCCRIKSLNFSFVFGLTTATISDRDDYRRKTVPEKKHTNITRDVLKLHEEMRSTVSDDGCKKQEGKKAEKNFSSNYQLSQKSGQHCRTQECVPFHARAIIGFHNPGHFAAVSCVSGSEYRQKKKTVAECAITRDT